MNFATLLSMYYMDPILICAVIYIFMNNIGYVYILEYVFNKNSSSLLTSTTVNLGENAPIISIVIPTYNEELNIKRKIENIFEYDYPLDKLEIIIVDDGSTDKTKDLITNLAKNYSQNLLDFRLISLNHQGPANALNTGTKEAKGEFILWTDADAYHTKYNLSIGASHLLNNNQVGAVCGTTQPTSDTKDRTVRSTELKIRDKLRFYESSIDSILYTNATFLLFRSQFKNLILNNINYDSTLALRIRKNGFKVIFDPNIVSYHIEPLSVLIQLRRKKRIFLGVLELFSQNICMNFNPKYGKFGMIIAPRNMFFYIFEPLVFVVLLVKLYTYWNITFIYFSLLLCLTLYILLYTKYKNIALLLIQQILGYLLNFLSYFEFIIKFLFNVKLKYTPGKE